jgi:oligoribonuclease (3'-5' exoribonuclease)
MTGLDHTTDLILSLSCYITTPTLTLLDQEGYHAIIATPSSTLASMSEWCIATHGSTGLTTQCLNSTLDASTASSDLLSYIKMYVPEPRTALLAGNSVHVDKLFLLREPWTKVVEYLHYRILDVSAIKEGVRRWCGEDVLGMGPVKAERHEAKGDVLESIEEARFYMRLFAGLGEEGGRGSHLGLM